MRIKALKPFKIAIDGIGYKFQELIEGDSIDAAEDIAAGLIKEGYAEAVVSKVEEKAVTAAPENKAIEKAPRNEATKKAE